MSDEADRPRRVVKAVVVSKPTEKPVLRLPGPNIKNWRQQLLRKLSDTGTDPWEILASIARGEAIVPQLPDGREGPPVIPTTADRLRAATELIHMYHGKPVDQTQVLEAERVAGEVAELRAMSYEEVKKLAARILTEDIKQTAEEVEVTGHAEDPTSDR